MTKPTTFRIPDELADEAAAVARVRDTSMNQLFVDALSAEVQRARKDKTFVAKANKLIKRDQELLERLAK